ncbi:MAG: DUF1517 domain-containing protein [Microcystis aeruginosa K13-07]|nr:DUF1517 domain-containing protein [Microcystis aeruginosa K13-07]
MIDKILTKVRSLAKPLIVIGLVTTLILGNVPSALAASGGRMGGGSFRAPSRSISPSRGGGYSSPGYGGGIGFPFLLPFFWGGGGGGLISLLIFFAIANFLVNAFRNGGGSDENGMAVEPGYETVSVAKVQVGLLANARYLQQELNQIALTVDTSTSEGRVDVLQESALALLRHPEYWVYGNVDCQQTSLSSAEAKFNQWSLNERGKLTAETLTNYNNQLRQGSQENILTESAGELAKTAPEGYILVTILAGIVGKFSLPKINDSQDLKQALQQIGSMGGDRLLAVEVIWTPQSEGDILSQDDILANYPDLKLV